MVKQISKNLLISSCRMIFNNVQSKISVSESEHTGFKVNYDSKNQTASVAKDIQRKDPLVVHKTDIMQLASPEFIAFLFQFAVGLSSNVITNVWLKSYCLLIPNITTEECSGAIPKEIENEVQPQVSQVLLMKTVIETFLPGLAVLFVGPWSDSHGRRPILLLSMLGFALSYTLWAVLSLQANYLNPLYFLIAAIPIGLTGGFTTFFLSIVCAISDITTVQKRAFKMAVFEAACMAGVFVSQLITAKVSAGPYGFVTTFSISAITCFTLFFYILFFFPETVLSTQEIQPKGSVSDAFKTFFKKRQNHERSILMLIIIANTAFILIVFGESSIFYLNMQKRFSWQLEEYSRFTSAGVICAGFVLYFGTWLMSSLLKMDDLSSLLLVSVPRIISSLIYGFCSNWRFLYLGMVLSCLATLITPLYRSKVSKLVPLHELGKIMSFVMLVEAFVPVTGTDLYTIVYNRVIEVFPGGVFLVSAILSVICTVSIMLAYILQWLAPNVGFAHLSETSHVENDVTHAEISHRNV